MIKPEGFTETSNRQEFLWMAKEKGFSVEALIEKVTWPETLDTCVWELDLGDGIKGLVPLSETGLGDTSLMLRFVGQKVLVKIKKIDGENQTAACSRREALIDAQEMLFKTLKEGQVIECTVKAIMQNTEGKPVLQVDVGGGFLVEVPRAQATRSRAKRLGDIFKPGQTVKAQVTQVDGQTGTVRVDIAAAEPDPWGTESFKRGDIVAGRVAGTTKEMVFLEIKPGLTGIANLPLRGNLRRGDVLPCVVTSFDREKKKLHLKLRGGKLA